ncbi:MAG: sugar phosphate isomerase/epimerase [Candidatus Hydrogenedentes bacterium]|nr:sugar phosphate isomerase/epimerase [Candidatus Hydrogenedentota bacterium]
MLGMGAAVWAQGAGAAHREFQISLAGWSLHRSVGEGEGQIAQLDMPQLARDEFGIDAIELVNTMLASTEPAYVDRLAKNAADRGVRFLLIMVDREGALASPDPGERDEAVRRHAAWLDIAAGLGCHSIRVNWHGAEAAEAKDPVARRALIERSTGAFRALCEQGDSKGLNVLVENHGGPSSYPEAMVELMEAVGHERFGTLPDFGNFPDDVDRYGAVDSLMSHAKAVSAKCIDFDDETGRETTMDYERLMEIVVDKHGYHGHIGIEYGGNRLSEFDGIKACKRLLERLRRAGAGGAA